MGEMQRERRRMRVLRGDARAKVTLRASPCSPPTIKEALRRLDDEGRLWSRSAKKALKLLMRFGAKMERLPVEFNRAIFDDVESLYEP